MINTTLQDLSFLTPKLPETEGSFITGLAKGFTKSAMRGAGAKEGAEPDFPGLEGKNGEIGPTPPKPEKKPGLLEKVSGFFTDPMAMQKYRQQSAQTKQEEQKASLGEVLQRDMGGLIEQFKSLKTPGEMFSFMKDNAGITVTQEGNQLMAGFAKIAGQIDQAERLSDAGMQRAAMQKEMGELIEWGYVPGQPQSAVQARKNRWTANNIQPLMGKVGPFDITDEMFDQFGNAKLEQIYSALSKAPTRETGSVPASVATIRAALESGAITKEQANQYLGGAANLASTRGTSGTVIQTPDGTIINQYTGEVPPVIGRQAQDTVDTGIKTLDNIDVLASGIDQNEAAIGAWGKLQGWKESALGVARPDEPQPVNEFRKKVDIIQKQLIPAVRGQTKGIIDVKEEARLNSILNFDSAIATPKVVKSILNDIRQFTAMDIVRQWSRAPVTSRQPLPQGVVDVISSPFVAGIMVRNGGVDPEVLKRLKIQTGPANANHIQALVDNAVIDEAQATDLVLYNVANPDKSDIRLEQLVELMRNGAFDPNDYPKYEALVKKMNPKATYK